MNRRRPKFFPGKRDKYGVIDAKELKWQIEEWKDLPSRVLLSGYACSYFGYVLIHSYQPNSPENYKVHAFENDVSVGLKNTPVSDVIPKHLLVYLK